MILGTFIKQPTDVVDYDVEYQEWLVRGDTLVSATVAITPDTDLEEDATYVLADKINIWLSGGLNGSTYKLTVTATTAAGRVRQDEFRVKCKEF
jgi:hypothetical protein